MSTLKKTWLLSSFWNFLLYSTCFQRSSNISFIHPIRYPKIIRNSVSRQNYGRQLTVVLPVMQGYSNISGEKLQFFFTKPPVTMVVEDPGGHKTQSHSPIPYYKYEPTTEMETSNEHFYPTETSFTPKSSAYDFYTHNAPKTIPTTKESSLKMYESIKHLSLKPLALPETDNFNEIRSDGQYFNVLEEILAPGEVVFAERSNKTKFNSNKIRYSTNANPYTVPKTSSVHEYTSSRPPLSNNLTTLSNTKSKIVSNDTNSESHSINESSLNEKLVFEGLQNVRTASDKLTNEITTMLVNLGILRTPNETTNTEKIYAAEKNDSFYGTELNSHLQFKKIPTYLDGEPARDDMQKLLDSFGLLPKKEVDNSLTRITRETKLAGNTTATRKTRSQQILIDLIISPRARNMRNFFELMNPNNFRNNNVHEKYDPKTIDSKGGIKSDNSTKVSLRENFGKTLATPLSRLSEMAMGQVKRRQERQNRFLDRRRQLELLNRNGKRRRQMTVSTQNTTTLNSANKNETISPRIGNSASESELMDSFGGNVTEDVTTTQPNGLYFFVDWNTFMNVGMPDENMVQVKFSPRAGNPRNFIPITLP